MSSGMFPMGGLPSMAGQQMPQMGQIGQMGQMGQMPGMPGAAPAAAIPPDFDPAWYLKNNPDVAAAGVDPLKHFMEFGAKEGRAADPAQAAAGRWTQLTKDAALRGNEASGQIPQLDPSDPNSWAAFMSRGNAQVGSFNSQPRVKNLGMGTQG